MSARLIIASAASMPIAMLLKSIRARAGSSMGRDVPMASWHYTIRKLSFSTHRLMRLKLIGLVMPSPVGLAIVKEQKPSPP